VWTTVVSSNPTRTVTWPILTSNVLRVDSVATISHTSLYTLSFLFHHGHRSQNPFQDTTLLQVFDEPFNGPLEGAFLGSLHRRVANITADSESMGCTLVVSAAVARCKICKFLISRLSKGFREGLIQLAAIDQERSLALRDVRVQIFRLEKRRMGSDGHMDDIVERKIEHKAGTVTVTRTTIDGYALLLKTFDDLARALTSVLGAVFANPRAEVKFSSAESIRRDGVTLEEIWRIYLEPVTSKVVDKETAIWELEAKDVWKVDDGLVFRVINLRSTDICLDAVDHFILPLVCALVANAADAVLAETHPWERREGAGVDKRWCAI